MYEKSSILKEELEYVYGSLKRTVEGISEQEYLFKPTEVSNSIQWNLNHLSRIINLSIPRICMGDSEYTPEGWAEDYRNKKLSLDEVMKDIEKGSKIAQRELGKLSNKQLDDEVPLWGGTRLRKIGLFAYIGEIYHHKGQIAYIKGTYKRLNE
jgi:hypothetical protein